MAKAPALSTRSTDNLISNAACSWEAYSGAALCSAFSKRELLFPWGPEVFFVYETEGSSPKLSTFPNTAEGFYFLVLLLTSIGTVCDWLFSAETVFNDSMCPTLVLPA